VSSAKAVQADTEIASNQYLSEKQVSQRIGISVQTLRRWRSEGREMPPNFKIGPRLVRYPVADFESWLQSVRCGQTKAGAKKDDSLLTLHNNTNGQFPSFARQRKSSRVASSDTALDELIPPDTHEWLSPCVIAALRVCAASHTNSIPRKNGQVVYFLADGDAIKIGTTKGHPSARANSMNSGNPRKIDYLYSIWADRTIEATLHALFQPFLIQGEWFTAGSELKTFLKLLPTVCNCAYS
jgi:predicted DNA-binding transcriptional regulator AlpA